LGTEGAVEHLPAGELSAKELFEHMKKLARSPILLERLKTLWVGAELGERLEKCSDHEVGELVAMTQKSMGIFSPEFAVCEHARRRLFRSSPKPRVENWLMVRDAGAELLNAEAALFRSGIPHMLLPFQKNRFASNVFYVPNAAEARACLLRQGFRRARSFDSTLMDSQTNREIRLVEEEWHS
jgi:hypothetical protein